MRILLCLSLLGACSNASSETSGSDKTDDKPVKMAGVSPREFKCDSITTIAQVGETLGGSAEFVAGSSTTVGIPAPCSYQVTTQAGPEYWMWDVDCRATYKKTADALFEQYKQTSAELVEAYKNAQDAPKAPPPKHKEGKDAPPDGPPERAPEGAVVVDVGSKGLDHHGRGLIFIDDDAPCYVRVVGADAPRRFELAKLVAKNLTFANAPMSPRPFP